MICMGVNQLIQPYDLLRWKSAILPYDLSRRKSASHYAAYPWLSSCDTMDSIQVSSSVEEWYCKLVAILQVVCPSSDWWMYWGITISGGATSVYRLTSCWSVQVLLDPSSVLLVQVISPQPTLYVELLAHVAHRYMMYKVQEPLLSSWYTSYYECTCFPTLPPSHHSFECTFVFELHGATATKVGFCVVEGEK